MTRQWNTRAAVTALILLSLALGAVVHARQDAVGDLRDQLRDRYDVLSLQDGVGLVPRSRDAGIRIIEIRNGAVSIDGMTATGDQLRMRLGADADLILRISYLDAAQQRQLSGNAQPGATSTAPVPPAPPVPPVPPVPENGPRRERRGDEIVRFGSDVTVERDEIVEEVVVIGGNATINGEVDGELTVVGGNATLGPEAVVRDDVTIVGGTLNRAPGSVIEGRDPERRGRRRGGGAAPFPGHGPRHDLPRHARAGRQLCRHAAAHRIARAAGAGGRGVRADVDRADRGARLDRSAAVRARPAFSDRCCSSRCC